MLVCLHPPSMISWLIANHMIWNWWWTWSVLKIRHLFWYLASICRLRNSMYTSTVTWHNWALKEYFPVGCHYTICFTSSAVIRTFTSPQLISDIDAFGVNNRHRHKFKRVKQLIPSRPAVGRPSVYLKLIHFINTTIFEIKCTKTSNKSPSVYVMTNYGNVSLVYMRNLTLFWYPASICKLLIYQHLHWYIAQSSNI